MKTNRRKFTLTMSGIILSPPLFARSIADTESNYFKAKIVVNKNTYELNPDFIGKTAAAKLKGSKKGGRGKNYPTPEVDLVLEIHNISKQSQPFSYGGDTSTLILELKGPGAVNIKRMVPMTREYRQGKRVIIKTDSPHTIPIKNLMNGMRNQTRVSYWTEPGEYTLHVSMRFSGKNKHQLMTAKPVKLKVVAPKKFPIETTLKANKTTYQLDTELSGKKGRDKINAAAKKGIILDPPKVDLVLQLKNTSDKPFEFTQGGDQSSWQLKLEGPGALNTAPPVIMTTDMRLGKTKKIQPGETFEIPIKTLKYGMRGSSNASYWTEPGEYKLTATLKSSDGKNKLDFKAKPITLKVKSMLP